MNGELLLNFLLCTYFLGKRVKEEEEEKENAPLEDGNTRWQIELCSSHLVVFNGIKEKKKRCRRDFYVEKREKVLVDERLLLYTHTHTHFTFVCTHTERR